MSVLCAHRGASGNFPENTMSAFNEARSIGVKWIETDISLTSDNQLIIFHDNKLGRTARGEKKISNLEFQDLKNLDIGIWKGKEFKGERIVSLNQLLLWQEKHKISINYEIIVPYVLSFSRPFFLSTVSYRRSSNSRTKLAGFQEKFR